jgi:hypothetical protein
MIVFLVTLKIQTGLPKLPYIEVVFFKIGKFKSMMIKFHYWTQCYQLALHVMFTIQLL